MENNIESLLRKVLATQTIVLANQLKAGKSSTSDFIDEAIRLVNQKETEILRKHR